MGFLTDDTPKILAAIADLKSSIRDLNEIITRLERYTYDAWDNTNKRIDTIIENQKTPPSPTRESRQEEDDGPTSSEKP